MLPNPVARSPKKARLECCSAAGIGAGRRNFVAGRLCSLDCRSRWETETLVLSHMNDLTVRVYLFLPVRIQQLLQLPVQTVFEIEFWDDRVNL